MKTLPKIMPVPKYLVLLYEVHSSWWVRLLPCEWMSRLAGKYYVWKVKRKYARYLRSLEERKEVPK